MRSMGSVEIDARPSDTAALKWLPDGFAPSHLWIDEMQRPRSHVGPRVIISDATSQITALRYQ